MNHEWAAGLFEGEGYIRQFKVPTHHTYEVRIKMTDYDILERMHHLYGGSLSSDNPPYKPNHKQCYVWALTRKAQVKNFLLNILPFLGLRRTYLALNALDAIDSCYVT